MLFADGHCVQVEQAVFANGVAMHARTTTVIER
jgi:hypothetical protein